MRNSSFFPPSQQKVPSDPNDFEFPRSMDRSEADKLVGTIMDTVRASLPSPEPRLSHSFARVAHSLTAYATGSKPSSTKWAPMKLRVTPR